MFNPATPAVYTLQQSNGLPYLKFEVPPGGLNSSAFLQSANGTIVSSYGLTTQGDSGNGRPSLVLMSNAEALGHSMTSDVAQLKNSDLYTTTGDKLVTLTSLKQEPIGSTHGGGVQYYSVGGNSTTVDLANSLIASILSNQAVTTGSNEPSRSNGSVTSNGQQFSRYSDIVHTAPLLSDGHSYLVDNRGIGATTVVNTTMTPLFLSTLESDDLSSPGSSKGNQVGQAIPSGTTATSTPRPVQVAPKKRRPIVTP